MNKRWRFLLAASLVAFASLVIAWQFRHQDEGATEPHSSLAWSYILGKQLAESPDILAASRIPVVISRTGWYYDLVLPGNARVFMTEMTGPTNYSRAIYYYYLTYYLFPREVGTSLDHRTVITQDGFLGRTSTADEEILTNGFDVRLDISPDQLNVSALANFPVNLPANPAWYKSTHDIAVAFLLPLLTGLAGMWLLRFCFPTLAGPMPWLEQLTCGLGLGMMAVASLTLGIKLCGFHGGWLVFAATAVGAIAELAHDRNRLLTAVLEHGRKALRRPVLLAFLSVGALIFLILFRIAGLEGLADGDAAMAWLLKAKLIHLYSGAELVHWFSAPRLACAHLDYPTLVPSLHAATYDALGHVDEFVTKFWPTWMLLCLVAGLASLNRARGSWRLVSLYALLGLLLLPAIQLYVHWEGSTLPMIFFTVWGFVQCAFWLAGRDRARLGLGLTFLFGGAMSHFEGFIILALAGGWLLLPSARPPATRPGWRVISFWLLAALPFICLRLQTPSLNFESGWAGYAAHHPGITLSNWPAVFMILFARLFLSHDFADWTGADGRFDWIGKWDGFSSLYNQSTLGLPWLCLLLTVVLWFAAPARRPVMIWLLAMFVGTAAALTVVFSSFIALEGLRSAIILTEGPTGGRYLLPVLLAWLVTTLALFFADLPPSATPDPDAGAAPPPSTTGNQLPALTGGGWLVAGAVLILVLGASVLPKDKTASAENPLPEGSAGNVRDRVEPNPADNAGLQTRIQTARQLDQAGRFAEALQAYRETARLNPTNAFVLNQLAWSLAMNPVQELRNGNEAIQMASRAVELSGRQDPVFLETLAAAYAENGQPAKAREIAQTALALAVLKDRPKAGEAIRHFLATFPAGPPPGLTHGP